MFDTIDGSSTEAAALLAVALEQQPVIAAAQQRQITAITALQALRTREEVAAGAWDSEAGEFAVAEIAVALHCSQRTAGNLVGIGIALAERLPATNRAFAAGDIDLARVRVIVERTQHISDERVAVIEAAAVDRARTSNPANLGPKIDRIILAREPDAVFQRRRAATAEREVLITPIADGMAEIWGRLPGHDGVLLDSRLDQLARTVCPADPRHAARRADPLTCLVTDTPMTCGCGCQGSTPLPSHRRPQVIVTAATLLGVTQDPAELVGYGPIDPDLAR